MTETPTETPLPEFWAETRPGILTLATVMPDRSVHHVALQVGEFPSNPADALEWIEAVKRNLGVCALQLFATQLAAASAARGAEMFIQVGASAPIGVWL